MTLLDGLLLVAQIPYLGRGGNDVRRASLAVELRLAGDRLLPPGSHRAWWTGDLPTDAEGRVLSHVVYQPDHRLLGNGVEARVHLCVRPPDRPFADYHEYVTTYVGLIGTPVAEIDPTAHARVFPTRARSRPKGPFRYADVATTRAGIGAAAARIAGQSVGIVGLGGTGSYVLDLVAKCPVDAIHLYDDDRFEQHGAFRWPGAFTADEIAAGEAKVDVLSRVYSRLHRRIVPHALRIDARTAPMLDLLDHAFVCIDDATAKATVLGRLAERRIPYVDVGMGLSLTEDGIVGAVRTTAASPDTHAAAAARIPSTGDPEGIYATNVQTADLNALNAALAVIAWKRTCGFYARTGAAAHSLFVVETGRMIGESLDPEVPR